MPIWSEIQVLTMRLQVKPNEVSDVKFVTVEYTLHRLSHLIMTISCRLPVKFSITYTHASLKYSRYS